MPFTGSPESSLPMDPDELGGSLPELSSEPSHMNITHRLLKRKRDHDAQDCLSEMKQMFTDFISNQDAKFTLLQTSITEVITSMEFLSTKYDDIERKMGLLVEERKENKQYIKALEDRIEHLERASCMAKIEIRNVPKIDSETKENICEVVKSAGIALSVPMSNLDIKDAYRIRSKNKDEPAPIMVEFSTVIVKEKMLKAVKQFNKENKNNKLSSTHLKLAGPSNPIYISEMLTKKARRLRFLASDFAKKHGYKYCWTSYGKIYLREKEGSTHSRIDDEADLLPLEKKEFQTK